MPEEKSIYLVVPVKLPKGFEDPADLAKYLNKFIEIGLNDLQETVEDKNIDSDELDQVVANQIEWGSPFVEVKY